MRAGARSGSVPWRRPVGHHETRGGSSVQDHAVGLEPETGDKARDEPAYVVLDVGKAPAGLCPTQLDWSRELAIPLPAPNRVLRDAEALCDLLDREVEGIHVVDHLLVSCVVHMTRYARRSICDLRRSISHLLLAMSNYSKTSVGLREDF